MKVEGICGVVSGYKVAFGLCPVVSRGGGVDRTLVVFVADGMVGGGGVVCAVHSVCCGGRAIKMVHAAGIGGRKSLRGCNIHHGCWRVLRSRVYVGGLGGRERIVELMKGGYCGNFKG